jgi:hypothetical protein
MNVAIIGSRNFQDLEQVASYVRENLQRGLDTVVTGGARGVDAMAERAARMHGCGVIMHKPDYDKFGRGAPLVRNKAIVRDADMVVAFWDGKSRGTLHAISTARELGKKLVIKLDRETREPDRASRPTLPAPPIDNRHRQVPAQTLIRPMLRRVP